MMNSDALSIRKSVAQLKEGDVGVLSHQLEEKPDMGCQLSAAWWASHRGNPRRAGHEYLTSPTSTGRSGNLKTARRLSPRQPFFDQSRKTIPQFLWQRCWNVSDPPTKGESQIKPQGNPNDANFAQNALDYRSD